MNKCECEREVTRGTTPTFIYTFKKIDASKITAAYLTVKRNGVLLLEKSLSDAELKSKALTWTFTQEDTLKVRGCANVMLNWLTEDGTRGTSKEVEIDFTPNHKEEVIHA